MKKQTKAVIFSIALCMIFALGVFCVYAVKNFSLRSGGVIEFIAPGVNATISDATLSGVSKKTSSGTMSSFTITPTMTEEQIENLAGYKSWGQIDLLFDEESEGIATISFTITNNSTKAIENIMVELSTNTNSGDSLHIVPSADFCIGASQNHTFSFDIYLADVQTTSLNNFSLKVKLRLLKENQVSSITEFSENQQLTFETNASAKTATFTKCEQTEITSIEIPAVVKNDDGQVFTVTEIKASSGSSNSPFYGIKDALTSVKLPSTLTKIGEYAFYGCKKLTQLPEIPLGVTTIGEKAFGACTGFTGDLVIPNGVKIIDEEAFYYCTGISGDIVIPDSVTTINYGAFYNCTAMKGNVIIGKGLSTISYLAFRFSGNIGGIIVSESNQTFYSVNNCLIEKATKTLVIGCKNSVIPRDKNVEIIGIQSFEDSHITGELIIPSNIKTIESQAFYGADITSLIIEDGVETIEKEAFYSCLDFEGDLFIPKSLTTIGEGVFAQIGVLNSISVDAQNPNYYSLDNCLISKQNKVLIKGCPSSKIPENEGIKEIGKYAFYECKTIAYFCIPNTVEIIRSCAFYGCQYVSGQLIIPESVVKIEGSAFYMNDGFKGTLIVGNGVTAIGGGAFKYCRGITDVIIGTGVTSIYDYAFQYATQLQSITINATTPPKITSSTFVNMSRLTTIYVPAESLSAYQSATSWKNHASLIQAIPA